MQKRNPYTTQKSHLFTVSRFYRFQPVTATIRMTEYLCWQSEIKGGKNYGTIQKKTKGAHT